ncbi:hypothetical protein F7725_026464 [Dissostichus mawsoni]|uniref:Uncharacterized protein n=1 Tax=Dissostichus mawsoni TaxID=36200 RepID=A0A7J5X822_DISMA|nr:hypothetical protein F7725_026464 [Dissostichus mawsoni]
MVQDIEEYLQKVALKNVLTGEIVTNVKVDKLLCCLTEGSAACAKFIDDRLRNRSISIHSTISRIKFRSPKTILKLTSKADIKDETIKALKFIEYGCHRGSLLRSYSSMRSPTLHSSWLTKMVTEEECQIATWG